MLQHSIICCFFMQFIVPVKQKTHFIAYYYDCLCLAIYPDDETDTTLSQNNNNNNFQIVNPIVTNPVVTNPVVTTLPPTTTTTTTPPAPTTTSVVTTSTSPFNLQPKLNLLSIVQMKLANVSQEIINSLIADGNIFIDDSKPLVLSIALVGHFKWSPLFSRCTQLNFLRFERFGRGKGLLLCGMYHEQEIMNKNEIKF